MLKLENITKQTQRAKEYFEDKVAFTVGPVELKEIIDKAGDRAQIVDVRRKEDYDSGHVPSSISVPGKEVESRLNEFSKDKINIVYCYSQQCHLAAKAAVILASNGYPVIELEGGFNEWKNYGYEIAK